MSLYTKYRPRDWDSIVGQENIVTILRTSLITGRVGHAYIFTGSRGTGKTTSARILAKAINCSNLQNGNPCHKCKNCSAFDAGNMLDIIEIDAASNSGVDNIRDLIEKAKFKPSQGTYKVYIIDEVHMLSGSAFNALLKTLEEPPEHVKFILATTEIHEVPETIRSRVLRFDFRKISKEIIITLLQEVSKKEKIQTEAGALALIAQAARGGLRDALTLLEQNTIDGALSTVFVEATLSLIDEILIQKIVEALAKKDQEKILILLEELRSKNIEVRGFFDQILYRVRDAMLASFGTPEFHAYEEVFLLIRDTYQSIRLIPDGWLLIEMTLLRGVASSRLSDTSPQDPSNEKKTPSHDIQTTKERSVKKEPSFFKETTTTEVPIIQEETKKVHGKKSVLSAHKSEVLLLEKKRKNDTPVTSVPPNRATLEKQKKEKPLDEAREKNTTFSYQKLLNSLKNEGVIAMGLKNASYALEQTSLMLTFSNKWQHEKLNTPKAIMILQERLVQLFGGDWRVIIIFQEASSVQENKKAALINDIF